MRHVRWCLILAGALVALLAVGPGSASAAVTNPCQTYSSQLSAAKAKLKTLRHARNSAHGAARATLSHAVARQKRKITRLQHAFDNCMEIPTGTPGVKGSCVFRDAGPGEEAGDCEEFLDASLPRDALRLEGAPIGVTTMKVVLPGGRQVTNYLCPAELPTAQIATTNTTNDSLVCSGGSLAIGDQRVPTMFHFNVRMTPDPVPGMGGQLFLAYAGLLLGPFPITGP